MENLRSALDYMAHDVYEAKCQPVRVAAGKADPRNIYFPYGKTTADFFSGVQSSLPDLKTISIDIYNILESVQPYKIGNNWLYDLCSILNEKKHERLVPQERKETGTYTVSGEQGSISIATGLGISITSMPGAVKIFGVPAEFLGDRIVTHPAGGLTHEKVTWVAFIFEGTSVNVLGLLEQATSGISKLNNELYARIS